MDHGCHGASSSASGAPQSASGLLMRSDHGELRILSVIATARTRCCSCESVAVPTKAVVPSDSCGLEMLFTAYAGDEAVRGWLTLSEGW